jgi:tetratricopeptide (TPR) repeat protein
MVDTELDRLLRQGIAAARAGEKGQARDLLLQVIARDEEVEAAWLWLSGVVDEPEERQICLENVLTLNPHNVAARNGLRWLEEHDSIASSESAQSQQHPARRHPGQGLTPVSGEAVSSAPSPHEPSSPPAVSPIEIDPYGCPYCGGSVGGEGSHCTHCHRPVLVRQRKRAGSFGLGWLVLSFVLQAAVAGLEGYFVSQLVQLSRLPAWLIQSAVYLLVGSALFTPEGVAGDLAVSGEMVILVNYALALVCLAVAVGMAFRSRVAYFGAFLLAGLLAMATGAGLLTHLTGWVPALVRLALIAVSIKWLVDSAPAFEWQMRRYDASLAHGLKTDLDYHNRGQRYHKMGMWAKAAAHWKIAIQLAPGQVRYYTALASAYARMGYLAAALSETDKALARAPDDEQLHAFRNSLARLEENP